MLALVAIAFWMRMEAAPPTPEATPTVAAATPTASPAPFPGWETIPTTLKLQGIPCTLGATADINLMPYAGDEGTPSGIMMTAWVTCGSRRLEVERLDARHAGKWWSGAPDEGRHLFRTDLPYQKGEKVEAAAMFRADGQTYFLRLGAPVKVDEVH